MPLEFWNSLFDWASVVLLALTFAVGAGAIFTGRLLAAKQEEHIAVIEQQTEKLHRENLELEASLSPRIFKDQSGAAKVLSVFSPINAVIEYLPDRECQRTAGQIALTLNMAGWTFPAAKANPDEAAFFDEVIVQVNAAGVVPPEVRKAGDAADALVVELNKTDIKARRHAADLSVAQGVIVIRVGMKPNPALKRLISDRKENAN